MAIVPDLSENFPNSLLTGTDTKLSSVNRQNAGTPISVLTPLYSGELVLDTLQSQLYMGTGTANTSWVPVHVSV
ncbi:hypothetical protein UFOVP810_37 [uncultured Caudovirales phage]|uniref:Uncharacterized protein n=1 Tax=uncultured Caudovirales phage TaxID=2100421 RepID=A0A6J5P355_9CAUD|nr:hypothetical protein UFOVP810_37 [uncultured Caudovirales phage]